jgi:hypothetical protein
MVWGAADIFLKKQIVYILNQLNILYVKKLLVPIVVYSFHA